MNKKLLVNRFVDSILYRAGRAGRVVARVDDPRIASGELVTDKQARAHVAKSVRRTLAEEEREAEREIREAFIQALTPTGHKRGQRKVVL